MGSDSFLKISPKKEEEQVPDNADQDIDIMDELEGIWRVDENEEKLEKDSRHGGQLSWDFMEWEGGFGNGEQEEEDEEEGHGYIMAATRNFLAEENNSHHHHDHERNHVVKKENLGFWDGCDGKRVSLNLSLNYQEVLDAWSDRGPLWADDYSHLSNSKASNDGYYVSSIHFKLMIIPLTLFLFSPSVA